MNKEKLALLDPRVQQVVLGLKARLEYLEAKGRLVRRVMLDLRESPAPPDRKETLAQAALLAALEIRELQVQLEASVLRDQLAPLA